MTKKTADAIGTELDSLIAIISEAASRVKIGVIMNINEVEENVARICQEISALPPEEAQTLEQSMAEMIGKLEDLAAALNEFQNKNGDGTD